MIRIESIPHTLTELAHQGYVVRDETFQDQPNAVKVVREAVLRARMGICTPIRWYPIDFYFGDDSPDEFENRIQKGVDEIVMDLVSSDKDLMALDDDDVCISVEHLRHRSFKVYILWHDPEKFMARQIPNTKRWKLVSPS